MTSTTPSTPPVIVNDEAVAKFLGCSVAMVRKDRRTKRRIPFFRFGALVKYDLDRVRAAMNASTEGGAS